MAEFPVRLDFIGKGVPQPGTRKQADAAAGATELQTAPIRRTPQSLIQDRITHASQVRGTNQLIATAAAFKHQLVVVSCSGETVIVPWKAVRALKAMPPEQRSCFEVDVHGSFLHWPDSDIHIDLDGLRMAIDPVRQAEAARQRQTHNESLGAAMRRLRERAGIRQHTIEGLSVRQIHRVEQGLVQPRLATYERLARAHGLTVNAYLNAVAEEAAAPSRG
jgi:hypothetical protein